MRALGIAAMCLALLRCGPEQGPDESDDANGGGNLSTASASELAKDLYHGVLRREPAPSEVDGLASRLSRGTSVETVEREFMASDERARFEAVRDDLLRSACYCHNCEASQVRSMYQLGCRYLRWAVFAWIPPMQKDDRPRNASGAKMTYAEALDSKFSNLASVAQASAATVEFVVPEIVLDEASQISISVGSSLRTAASGYVGRGFQTIDQIAAGTRTTLAFRYEDILEVDPNTSVPKNGDHRWYAAPSGRNSVPSLETEMGILWQLWLATRAIDAGAKSIHITMTDLRTMHPDAILDFSKALRRVRPSLYIGSETTLSGWMKPHIDFIKAVVDTDRYGVRNGVAVEASGIPCLNQKALNKVGYSTDLGEDLCLVSTGTERNRVYNTGGHGHVNRLVHNPAGLPLLLELDGAHYCGNPANYGHSQQYVYSPNSGGLSNGCLASVRNALPTTLQFIAAKDTPRRRFIEYAQKTAIHLTVNGTVPVYFPAMIDVDQNYMFSVRSQNNAEQMERLKYCPSDSGVGRIESSVPAYRARDCGDLAANQNALAMSQRSIIEDYVRDLYRYLLGRTPTSERVAYWSNQIEAGWTASQLAQHFMGTQEYATIVSNNSPEDLVDGLYRGLLGREPTRTTEWANLIRNGTKTIYTVAADFMYTDEYKTRVEDIKASANPTLPRTQPQDPPQDPPQNPTYTLDVGKLGNGNGTITSNPSGINCGTDCTETYQANTSVVLSATALGGSTFSGWSGACSGSSAMCTVSMSAARSVTANFSAAPPPPPQQYALTVSKSGSGTVSSNPSGINCGSTCSNSYSASTNVTLTASPSAGWIFSGWSGACSGSSATCTVTMSSARTVTASFSVAPPQQYALTVSKSGSGTVSSNPSGINCGSTCSNSYSASTNVTLTASPSAGWIFSGWSGACSGSSATCTVTMSSARTVTASFSVAPPQQYALTVSKSGSGTVSSNPSGINCGSTCSNSYSASTNVTLTASPSAGWIFSGWSGACSGSSATCTVTMSSARTVTASFSVAPPQQYALTVSKSGSGTVSSNPSGINCGSTCSNSYSASTNVTLTASPSAGWIFSGWSGACSGSSATCTVTMSSARTVTASFSVAPPPPPQQYALTVSKSGSGTVSSNPSGINCGSTCSNSYSASTNVTLTASPSAGWIFSGWSGACSGSSATCTVTMSSARTVTASFSVAPPPPPQQYALTVSKSGSGTIASFPSGMNCGTACSVSATPGETVWLIAQPSVGSDFSGWGGACSGSSLVCTVTLTGNRSVTATFVSSPTSDVVERYIRSLYPTVFLRAGDSSGVSYWTQKAKSDRAAGKSAPEAYSFILRTFFSSSTYKARTRSDREYLLDVYALAFGRAADQRSSGWMTQLAAGADRDAVLVAILGSTEFASHLQALGL
ncbi:MAG: DUF4214 domain-containing protein [Deltaproteobacteria bacterium]|nr:DUF4214 domain-containing protein [Deltaproteobacteria bacterium]